MQNKTQTALAFLMTSLLLLSLSACSMPQKISTTSKQAVLPKRIVTLNLGTEPPHLDPIKMTDLTSFNVANNLLRGLTRFDDTQNVISAMAERWQVLEGGAHYRFYLRSNAKWSDGKAVLAQHFVEGWQRALTASNGSSYAFLLYPVKGAKAFNEGKSTDFTSVGIKATSERVLDIYLEKPLAFFPALMASPVTFPFRKDVFEKSNGRCFSDIKQWVGNGPYLPSAWQHEHHLSLKPNPAYFKPVTGVDEIKLLMVQDANTSLVLYEKGQLHMVESPTSLSFFEVRRLQHKPEAQMLPLHVLYYLGFNTQLKPFTDVRVRKAFAMAIDRRFFPKLLQGGQKPESSFISPGLEGYDAKLGLQFNPEKAKALLAEAGFPEGKGFPEVEFAFPAKYELRKEAEIAQFLWRKHLGVQVKLSAMDWKVYLSRLAQEPPQLYKLSWYVDYPDADSYLSLFTTGNGNNYSGWNDKSYDHWVAEAAGDQNQTHRKELYSKAQKRLLEEDVVLMPWYVGQKLWLLNPCVKGIVINRMNLWLLDEAKMPHPETCRQLPIPKK